MRTAGVLGLLALWQGAAVLLGPRGRLILPPPRAVLERLFALGAEGAFWADGGRTLLEVSAALGLILGLGLFLGVALGASRRLDALCEPALALLQATPVVSWLALAVFAFGIGWRGPVLLTTLNLLPLATLTVRSGFRSVDGELLEMARVFRVPRGRVLARIVLPSLRPFLGAALDVAAPGAWKAVLVTEYLCGDGGWGVRLAWARQTVDTPALYAVTLAAVLGGWGFERLLRRMGRRFSC